MNQRLKATAMVFLAVFAAATYAAEFSVTPVRIFMTPRDRAVAITVVNEGDEEMVMQSELFLWKQTANGDENLTVTDDLVLSPPITRLAPRSRQVIRLARVGPPPTSEERQYRLVVREVPEAKPSKDMKVQLALAFSLPVFITPNGARRQLSCKPERAQADLVRVYCENTGTAYAQARAFTLTSATGERLANRDSGGYLLPEVKRTFELKGAARIPGGRVKLDVALDDGTSQSFEGTLPD